MKKHFGTSLLFFSFLFLLNSCEKKSTIVFENDSVNNLEIIQTDSLKNLKSELRPKENFELGKIYTDTVEFTEFNDDGDYRLYFVKRFEDTIDLITELDSEFVRGDELEIQWKLDSLRPAGDPEFLDFREFLISAKKINSLKIPEKNTKVLWRENLFDEELNMEINSIVLNENYIKTISEPEKAALAYIATFIGNECSWEGKATDDRSNLKCKIPSALDLGYQCSERHLGFLRNWFRSEKGILKELENCPTTPDGATIQNTFDEINLEVRGNKILVSFKASGFNMREGKSWKWNEKLAFEFKNNQLFLVQKDKSEIKHSDFEVQGN